ncbi:MAG: hypothetical protein ACRYHQ_40750 [Janthinobacterium lividum]
MTFTEAGRRAGDVGGGVGGLLAGQDRFDAARLASLDHLSGGHLVVRHDSVKLRSGPFDRGLRHAPRNQDPPPGDRCVHPLTLPSLLLVSTFDAGLICGQL